MPAPRNTQAAAERWALYQSGLSCDQIGARVGVSGTSVWLMLTGRGYRLRPNPRKISRAMWKAVTYNGQRYTPSKDGYLRCTHNIDGKRVYIALHRVIWEEHHGPIPAGHVVTFRDGNRGRCSIENLELMTVSQMIATKSPGNNRTTKGLAGREFPEKCCRACGKRMEPHTPNARRANGETPAAFNRRQTCGPKCSRDLLRGKPRGTRGAVMDYRAMTPRLPDRRAQTIGMLNGGKAA